MIGNADWAKLLKLIPKLPWGCCCVDMRKLHLLDLSSDYGGFGILEIYLGPNILSHPLMSNTGRGPSRLLYSWVKAKPLHPHI